MVNIYETRFWSFRHMNENGINIFWLINALMKLKIFENTDFDPAVSLMFIVLDIIIIPVQVF